jgi:hypothetical protein
MAVAAHRSLTIPRVAGDVKMDGTAAGFPGTPAEQISGKRLVQGTDAGELEASFKLCWDDNNLYLLADITDKTPMLNTRTGDALWSGDGIELFVGPDHPDQGGPPLFSDRQIMLSAGQVDGKPQFFFTHLEKQPDCKLVVLPSANGYTVEAAIPFASIGFKPAANQQIRFDIGVDESANGKSRIRQIMWNGTSRNSGDRTGWGRATLSSQ